MSGTITNTITIVVMAANGAVCDVREFHAGKAQWVAVQDAIYEAAKTCRADGGRIEVQF